MELAQSLNNLDAEQVAESCIRTLNSLQDYQPAIQVATLITMTALLMDIFKLDLRQEVERMERLMSNTEHNGFDKKFAALRAYIVGELKTKHQ